MERTDLVSAYEKVISILKEGRPYTLSGLSAETGLNPRTIKKSIELIKISEDFCRTSQIEISHIKKMHLFQAKPRGGLTRLSDNIQNLLIRNMYFPTVSREEEILVYLHLKSAKTPKKAIDIPEDSILSDLVDAEYVAKTRDKKFYLTEDGQMIAKGSLEIYPELNQKNVHDLANIALPVKR